LLDQSLISLPPENAEPGLAPSQDFVQLALCRPGEQYIA
jgi:hypothetical protein